MEVPWEASQECPQTSCPMDVTYTLALSGLQTAGLHTLEVIAVDFAGNEEDRKIEFEYIPATGMKDEYVMQYFPLPDGEGNEEEGHRSPELAVNVVNGNLVYRQKDIDVEGPSVDLEVERFYNSQLPEEDNTEWGDGWTLAQTPKLEPEEESESASMLDTSGAITNAVTLPSEPEEEYFDPKLRALITKEPGGGYTVEDQSGETDTALVFDEAGKVTEETTPGYAKVEYSYEEGDLSELAVNDPASFGGSAPEEPLGGELEAPAYLSDFGGAGSGPGTLSGPAGVALDAEGDVWVADTGHNRIQEFSPEGEFLRQFGAKGSGDGRLSSPRGIVFDSEGHLWVLDSGNNRIEEFSPKGEYMAQFGAKGSGNGQLSTPWGIAIDAEDNLWVADTYNNRVQEFDPEGTYLRQIGGKGTSSGLFVEPRGIAIDAEGHVVVADTGNHRIQGFSPEGQFVGAFGKEGTADGQFSKPASIAVDAEGNLWVTDSSADRVQEFDAEGQYLAQFGSPGNDAGQLSEPRGIATDAEGNVWVADAANDRVQEFAASEFILKFGGAGSEAGQLASPKGIATDAEGNVWVADTGHNRVQEFSSSGDFIRQFGASGSGPGQFSGPYGIATDAEGHVWVADTFNHRVQEFSSSGDFIRTFGSKGSGNGQFSSPKAIATDAEGNIWVADTFNHRVQEFSPQGELIRTFGSKGSGNGQLSEPQGIATDAAGNVWVADTGNHRVQEFTSAGGFIRAFGEEGTESGQLNSPVGLTVDPEGNLWVADTGNDRIQEFDAEGEYLAQLGATGNDAGQLSEPRGIALDSAGNLWVADTANNRVQEFAAGEFVRKLGGEGSEAGQLSSPGGLVTDSKGNLWVADTNHNRIQEFDAKGEFVRQFGGKGSGECQLSVPQGVALDAAGHVWVADSGNERIQEFGAEGQCLSRFGSAGEEEGQFGVLSLRDLAIDSKGHIWTIESSIFFPQTRVQEFSPQGELIRAFGSKGTEDGQFTSPQGIATDAEGNVWVADTGNHRVQEFDGTGDFIAAFGEEGEEGGQLQSPSNLAFSSDGRLWVADNVSDRVQEFSPQGEFLTEFGSAGNDEGQLSAPRGIATDSEGHIWIADSANNRVQKWQIPSYAPKRSSLFLSSSGAEGTAAAQLRHPAGLALDPEGNLWVADKTNNRVVEFDQAGEFLQAFGKDVDQTAVQAEGSEAERNLCTAASEDTCQAGEAGGANGQLSKPADVAIDAEGDLWVADKGNHRIEKFNSTGEYLDKFGSAGSGNGQLSQAEGVAIDPKGNIWVADTYNGRVQKFDSEGNFIEVVGSYGTGEGQMGEPTGIDIGPGGNVWIADWQDNRVEEFDEEGEFVRQFGTWGTENGQFKRPDAITINDQGQLWVADEGNDRVQSFTAQGEYIAQFGTTGSGEGQFNLGWPLGIATDSKGKLWIADSNNHRVQRWGVYNYVPADEPFVVDNDPKVEIETSSGLVDSVEGEAAGQTTYAHEGEMLTAVDGPAGETTYEYDEAERLTKVTLPNGTWGAVVYESIGRVDSVTVAVEGAEPKTTEFEYTDSTPRRTTVIPSDSPHVTYDIGPDGSVLKWWNQKLPPLLDLAGTLYDNRETSEPINNGDYWLESQAKSTEGIASIEVVADGDILVSEETCEQTEEPGIECADQPIVDEWITSTDLNSPGRLQLEVIATDRLGESTAERFWVEIPEPLPPPPPGLPVPPNFQDVLKFREEYGLEIVFPVANETERNERIFNLINAWYEGDTVARASAEKWGVPLRPVDVAELEYREWLYDINAEKIDQWVETTNPSSYAGYYMDHPAGGVMHIGFLGNQAEQLANLETSLSLVGDSSRLSVYPNPPTASYVAVQATAQAVLEAIESNSTLAGLVVSVEEDEAGKATRVGTPNVAQVESILDQMLGANAPVTVEYEAGGGALLSGRYRNEGRMRAGDYINSDPYVFESIPTGGRCTAGFGAEDRRTRANGDEIVRLFLLTAGHCAAKIDEEVWRNQYDGDFEFPFADAGKSEVGRTRRSAIQYTELGGVRTDGAAIRIEQGGIVPRAIWGWGGQELPTKPARKARKGNVVCYSGAISKTVACGKIVARSLSWEESPSLNLAGYWVRFPYDKRPQHGDSGAPVWNLRTGASIGLVSAGRPDDSLEETLVAPLLHPPNMPANRVPGILHHLGMEPLQLKLGG